MAYRICRICGVRLSPENRTPESGTRCNVCCLRKEALKRLKKVKVYSFMEEDEIEEAVGCSAASNYDKQHKTEEEKWYADRLQAILDAVRSRVAMTKFNRKRAKLHYEARKYAQGDPRKRIEFWLYVDKRTADQHKIITHYKEELIDIYLERNAIRDKEQRVYHVDHIMPVKHENFCGLTVPWNLQIITKEENMAKSNTWEDLK